MLAITKPSSTGIIPAFAVYEPRYLEMFKKLQDEAQGVRPDSLRFGHIVGRLPKHMCQFCQAAA
jgi:hypothetical protein